MTLRNDGLRNEGSEALQAPGALSFRQEALLEQARTHSSFVNECPDLGLTDNQRLEFLGDAILDFLVAEWLFERYPDAREGELTALRAHIVRTEGLCAFAREINLGLYLRLGRGEAASGGRDRPANLCAGFEALVGAIYLDQGLAVTRDWVRGFLERHACEIDERRASKDAKSLLQEHVQADLHVTPAYHIVCEEGPDHAKVFTARVLVGSSIWGEGRGSSKQLAEQAAAEAALRDHYPSPEDSR